jgi:hypothetical protein
LVGIAGVLVAGAIETVWFLINCAALQMCADQVRA